MMNKCFKHIDGVKVTAVFAEEGGFRYRYRLNIVLKDAASNGKTACVVMQNPSYAGEDFADKSVQFMENVVFKKNFAEFKDVIRLIVVNQFAFIQTNDFKGLPLEIGSRNDAFIKDAILDSDIVILGWGSSNIFEERKLFVLNLLKNMPKKSIYMTKMHPSRGQYPNFIQPFNEL